VEELENFRFSRLEGQIYLVLLKNREMNGSQIAKLLNIPRTSVYMALESLYQKGAVFLLPGEPSIYQAQNPKTLLASMKNRIDQSMETLERELSGFEIFGAEDQFWNIKGYASFQQKAREMLADAETEVLINTNYDLQMFSPELETLRTKKVRIVVFSFENQQVRALPVEFFYNPKKPLESPIKRMMLVVDNRRVFIASSIPSGETLGTFTENPLLVSIVSEHIHHDIYLYRLEQAAGKDLVDDRIHIGSMLEKSLAAKKT
jgi:sugar-specific transcriptional regulator TrmB